MYVSSHGTEKMLLNTIRLRGILESRKRESAALMSSSVNVMRFLILKSSLASLGDSVICIH